MLSPTKIVTLNSFVQAQLRFQGPFNHLRLRCNSAKWMLKQVQHDEAIEGRA